ncbi:MAG: polyhydroxyalkanoate synthesis regulator DNA-binding domain-containing protein [Bacteriovoracaceae bacterium]|nr:polyhydroxyalkanoate synthesis regulator DNA-binding domain-containing protein [Bacteriovoracaceae bacterium]
MKRIIKRYLNRKLYDTVQSTYVTLEDVAEMFRQGDHVKVLENNTNRDITYHTQLQMLFDLEKKFVGPENTELLRRIIVSPTGRVTGYVKSLEKALSIGHHEMEEKMPEVVVPKLKPAEEAQLVESPSDVMLSNNNPHNNISVHAPLESSPSNL